MPDGMDKGLSSSIWSPISSGRPPYYFKKSTTTTSRTSISSSTPAAVQVCHTETYVASPSTPSATANHASTPSSTGTTTPVTTSNTGRNPYQVDVSALNRIPTPWAELGRYTKIVRRLKWKLPYLAQGYHAATDHTYSTDEQRAEAELMFKLDFFEYYMLLERALVHLLGVFGIRVTGGFGGRIPHGNGGSGWHGKKGDRQGWEQSDHRFHANVLEALDDVRNPLHESLGKNDARVALARAKELRNRWKNADDPDAVLVAKLQDGGRPTRPLEEYDLERILEATFAGFDQGFQVAEKYVNEVRALATERSMDMTSEPAEEWEFMTDAMDWEAV